MEPLIIYLQIVLLLSATVAVTFGARMAFIYNKKLGHVAGISGVVVFWVASAVPALLHTHDPQYVAWESGQIYHVPGCPYGPRIEQLESPKPGMRPCDYCAATRSNMTAMTPQTNPNSKETRTVSAALRNIFWSITAPHPNIGKRGEELE